VAVVSILGAGVAGHATGVGLESLGHSVIFVDISAERLATLRQAGHTTHADEMTLEGVDAVFVAVPTPAGEVGIDLSYHDPHARPWDDSWPRPTTYRCWCSVRPYPRGPPVRN
jgi:UDP-glucose 6-dehydrogenase